MSEENQLYEWEEERLASVNSLIAYVYNLQNPSYSGSVI